MKLLANNFGISGRITELISNLKELESAKVLGISKVILSRAKFITPLSILPLVVYANQNKIEIDCTEKDNNVCSYLSTIGFPKGMTNLSPQTKHYLPITKMPPIEENTVLNEYEDRILAQSSMGEDTSFITSLKYLTSELVNNVNEHAQIGHYWLLAQYYERPNKTCEIVIADCGIGYKKSYKGTEFEVKTDKKAIENALEGKSSKSAKAKSKERGKGLPSIANMFVNGYGGKLIIISGKSMIYYKPKEKRVIGLKSYWRGSLIGINFNLKSIDVYKFLDV